ncbi:hypothetical protein HK102_006668 [Quaeritorhiza haematococci]|nr:hypothetical protein HK102_006668 [Quaeritorhiza haematococci]
MHHLTTTYPELLQRIEAAFFPDQQATDEPDQQRESKQPRLKLEYVDQDGAQIPLDSQPALEIAISLCQTLRRSFVNMFCTEIRDGGKEEDAKDAEQHGEVKETGEVPQSQEESPAEAPQNIADSSEQESANVDPLPENQPQDSEASEAQVVSADSTDGQEEAAQISETTKASNEQTQQEPQQQPEAEGEKTEEDVTEEPEKKDEEESESQDPENAPLPDQPEESDAAAASDDEPQREREEPSATAESQEDRATTRDDEAEEQPALNADDEGSKESSSVEETATADLKAEEAKIDTEAPAVDELQVTETDGNEGQDGEVVEGRPQPAEISRSLSKLSSTLNLGGSKSKASSTVHLGSKSNLSSTLNLGGSKSKASSTVNLGDSKSKASSRVNLGSKSKVSSTSKTSSTTSSRRDISQESNEEISSNRDASEASESVDVGANPDSSQPTQTEVENAFADEPGLDSDESKVEKLDPESATAVPVVLENEVNSQQDADTENGIEGQEQQKSTTAADNVLGGKTEEVDASVDGNEDEDEGESDDPSARNAPAEESEKVTQQKGKSKSTSLIGTPATGKLSQHVSAAASIADVSEADLPLPEAPKQDAQKLDNAPPAQNGDFQGPSNHKSFLKPTKPPGLAPVHNPAGPGAFPDHFAGHHRRAPWNSSIVVQKQNYQPSIFSPTAEIETLQLTGEGLQNPQQQSSTTDAVSKESRSPLSLRKQDRPVPHQNVVSKVAPPAAPSSGAFLRLIEKRRKATLQDLMSMPAPYPPTTHPSRTQPESKWRTPRANKSVRLNLNTYERDSSSGSGSASDSPAPSSRPSVSEQFMDADMAAEQEEEVRRLKKSYLQSQKIQEYQRLRKKYVDVIDPASYPPYGDMNVARLAARLNARNAAQYSTIRRGIPPPVPIRIPNGLSNGPGHSEANSSTSTERSPSWSMSKSRRATRVPFAQRLRMQQQRREGRQMLPVHLDPLPGANQGGKGASYRRAEQPQQQVYMEQKMLDYTTAQQGFDLASTELPASSLWYPVSMRGPSPVLVPQYPGAIMGSPEFESAQEQIPRPYAPVYVQTQMSTSGPSVVDSTSRIPAGGSSMMSTGTFVVVPQVPAQPPPNLEFQAAPYPAYLQKFIQQQPVDSQGVGSPMDQRVEYAPVTFVPYTASPQLYGYPVASLSPQSQAGNTNATAMILPSRQVVNPANMNMWAQQQPAAPRAMVAASEHGKVARNVLNEHFPPPSKSLGQLPVFYPTPKLSILALNPMNHQMTEKPENQAS